MKLTFERKLPIILFFVFLMLTIVGVLFYQNTRSAQDLMLRQRDSQDILSRVDETVAYAYEAYIAQDNFIEVSNNTYLDPIERNRPRIRQNIDRLRTYAAQDPANPPIHPDEIARLDETIKIFLAGVSTRTDERKILGSEYPIEKRPWLEGRLLLAQIRSSGDRIKDSVVTRQQFLDRTADKDFARTIWILIVASLAGIVSLGFANLTVLSEIRKRRAAQKELMQLNLDLEHNVEERTAQLKLANEKLMEVGLERESILFSEKEARQEAEIANRLRDEFMATVSHELRTPLNSILGWARMLKGGRLDEAQAEKALTTIIKNSETQNRLIEDLLDVARVISGKLELELVDLDPSEIVSEAIETVRPTADAKQIKIEFEPVEGEPVVIGDRNRLVQVYTNLLGNALKFSPPNSTVHVSLFVSDGGVITQVRDQGRGISANFLPLVFERFRQDLRNKSNNGGLGLGLAIVRNLVEMHGGTVKAESEGENRGSTFTVLLPDASVTNGKRPALQLQDVFDGN